MDIEKYHYTGLIKMWGIKGQILMRGGGGVIRRWQMISG